MSELKTASDLLYAFVAAEKRIEEAEQTILKSIAEKKEVLEKIKAHANLSKALKGSGVVCYEQLCIMNGGDEIELHPEPTALYSIKEEAEGDE